MSAPSKTGSHSAVKATTRAARAWRVDASKLVVTEEGDERASRVESMPVTAGAIPTEALHAQPTRGQMLATALVDLAAEEGLDAALEAIERGLMGMSILPTDAPTRHDLRGLSELIDVAAERMGLRGGRER